MDLFQNAFYVLGATPRDDRRRIVELAEERSLHVDPDKCTRARADLLNPRKRLSLEVAWLPGAGPRRVAEVILAVSGPPSALLEMGSLAAMARANVLAAGLSRLPPSDPHALANWLLELALALEDVDPDDLRVVINEDRVVSGFPEVSDLSLVEAEVQERRRYCRQVMDSALDALPSADLVKALTTAVDVATLGGEEQGPVLIDDLVDSYEAKAQEFIEQETQNIEVLAERLRTAAAAKHPTSALASLATQLGQVVRNWDTVAQPIQVSRKSRGLDHEASHRVARVVRDLAVQLFNEHGRIDLSQQLTALLQEVFAEVVEVSERTAEDANTLAGIAEERARQAEVARKREDEWRRQITFEADIGFIFKDKLAISPAGVEWQGRRWDLASVTRVRWGGTRTSVNGIPTGTQYTVAFGDRATCAEVQLKDEAVYTRFVDCLWRAVGVRLLTEYVEGLKGGRRYPFGSAFISDLGVEFERRKLFSKNERVFCRWADVAVWCNAGYFYVGSAKDKELGVGLPYIGADNIHVVEAVLRTFLKKPGGERLSSLFEDQ